MTLTDALSFDLLPPPPVVVEIAEPVEATLQIFRSVVLLLGHTMPRHPPAPLEVPARIVVPTGALKTAAEALIGLCLDDRDAGVGVARRALAFDIAARIVAAELEREPALVEAQSLRERSAGDENKGGSDDNSGDTHEPCLTFLTDVG